MKPSPYYPPRAGIVSRFLAVWDRLAVRLRLPSEIRLPLQRAGAFPHAVPWLMVPGLMWRGGVEEAVWGIRILWAWAILIVIYVVIPSESVANLAAMIASMLHGISAAAVLAVLYPQWQGFTRMWKTTLYAMLLVLAIYSVGLRMVAPTIAQRITFKGDAIMLQGRSWFSSKSWTPGEWVAYRLPNGGVNIDRILAGPGDTIRFHEHSFEVNGRFFERVSPDMPVTGEQEMESGSCFIWPTDARYAHGQETQDRLKLRLATVSESDIVGRPYHRWFWKSSGLEPLKPADITPP